MLIKYGVYIYIIHSYIFVLANVHFLKIIYLFLLIYFGYAGLSCGTWKTCCHVWDWGFTAAARGILVPGPGIELWPPALGTQSLSHWIPRGGPLCVWGFFFAALGLCCYWKALSSCSVWGSYCGGFSCCGARALGSVDSAVVVQKLSLPKACGIFPNQGSNLYPLHWQADP